MDTFVWEWLESPGLDVARVSRPAGGGWRVDGHAVFGWDGQVLGLRYRLDCDDGWRARDVTLRTDLGGALHHLVLTHDDAGWWADGVRRPELDAAVDVDIMATPVTNTLPIRRAAWSPGTRHAFTMAYIRLPDLVVLPMAQHYTMLSPGHFLYEDDGFTAELEVDQQGFVRHYPPYWRRLPPTET